MLRLGAGIALLLVALFMTVGLLNADQSMRPVVKLLTAAVTIGIPAAAGTAFLLQHFGASRGVLRRREALRFQTQQAEVLRMARRHDARLTSVEVVAELGMTPDDAEAALQELARKGIADIEITPSGLIVYKFGDVALLEEKARSKGVLDA